MSEQQREFVKKQLSALAEKWLFGRTVFPGDELCGSYKVQPGDFIVAGEDFGCGSSREHAVWAIRGAKVAAVIAGSFARIFYRNAINCGFLVVELPGIAEKVRNQDELEVDVKNGIITNHTQGVKYEFTPLPEFALEIIEAGGLLNTLAKK